MTDSARLSTLYITHGGGPCFWMSFPEPVGAHGFDGLKAYLAGVLATLPQRPKAIVMVSAHWEETVQTVSTATAPPMLYDYYGFPEHTYHLQYPAPGSPDLGKHIMDILAKAGIEARSNDNRGFDHGVFVPMMIIDPSATIPVVMLSIIHDLDAARHIEMGRALARLRDDGVLIIGSGSSYHNLREFMDGDGRSSVLFDEWLNETLCHSDAAERVKRLIDWKRAPAALDCHPREEHLIPLMVAVGAAQGDVGHQSFHDRIGGKAFSCFKFG